MIKRLRKSIRTQVIVILLVIMAVVFSVLSFFAFNQLRLIPNIIIDKMQEIAHARANELGSEVFGLKKHIEMISHSNITRTMDLPYIQPWLISMNQSGRFRNFTIADSSGRAWTTLNTLIDISNQDQFQAIFKQGKASYISDPFLSPFVAEPIPIITISYPIHDENYHVVGLINGVVSTQFIDDLLKSITYLNTGFAWIVDESGTVIAHSKDTNAYDITFFDITKLHSNILASNSPFTFHDDSVEYINVVATIPHTRQWKLILTVESNEAFQEINNIVTTMSLYPPISLIVLFILLSFLVNRFTAPLLALTSAFEQAKGGNLNVRANEAIENELGKAGKNFNEMLAQIKALTYVDPITGLNNYFSFLNEVGQTLIKKNTSSNNVYIMVISVNDFKNINTLYGYEIGNEALRQLARQIVPFLQNDEMLARHFGDEMICALIGENSDKMRSRVDTLLTFAQQPINASGIELQLTLSCGVAKHEDEDTLMQTIHNASMAKYRTKLANSTCEFYSNTVYLDYLYQKEIEQAVTTALDNNEFYLLYQPIYNMTQQHIFGYEALLRWKNANFLHVPINEVIKIIESKGYIHKVGHFIIQEALLSLQKLNKINPHTSITINISPLQLQHNALFESLIFALQTTRVNPHNIILEITEAATVLDSEKINVLNRLKSLGVRIAIDDFGSGYSSLLYITKLPIDVIKIDRDFINTIASDNFSHLMISLILSIAKKLDLMVIAEGVETQQQADMLHLAGCEFIQGYLISKPTTLTKADLQ